IWDVSDPKQPTVVASTAAFTETFAATSWGKFVYLVNGTSSEGVRAVNVDIGAGAGIASALFDNGANRHFIGFVPTGRFAYGYASPDSIGNASTLVKLSASTNLNVGTYVESSTLSIAAGNDQAAAMDANPRRIV